MPLKKPVAGSDAPRPLKTEQDLKRYTPTPRRESLPAPSVGIFDAPTRCLKINLEWWSHISGMIDTLSSEELWEGDSEEQARALSEIAALLAYNECEDSVTPEEYEEASYNAMYRAVNDVAKQIVSGRITNISVGEDGEVSDPTTGGGDVELPEDDPTTPLDEEAAANMGGAYTVRIALKLFFDKIDNYYGPVNGTPVTSAADTKAQIKSYFQTDEAAMDTAIDAYYTYRTSNPRHVFTPDNSFSQYLYCRGANAMSFSRWLADLSTYPLAKQLNMSALANALADSFWSSYFEQGTHTPSTDYVQASCTKIATEQFTLNMALAESFVVPFAGTFKAGHRYLLEATGSFTDADFPTKIQDFFWKHDTATGIKTFIGFTLTVSGTTNATAAQVPFKSDHKYAWTFDKTGTDGGSFTKTNDEFNITGAPVVGVLTVTVTDLGEFALV